MPRQAKPLNDTQIKQAKPKAKEYNLADGGGLSLRVKPNGTKQWLFNYSKPHTRKRSNLSIGIYSKLSLKQARKERDSFNELLARKIDPKDHRKEKARQNKQAHSNTFQVIYEQWLNSKKGAWADSYHKRITTAMELYILPGLGAVPIHKVNAPDTIELLSPLAERQALESVRKLCRWINEIMAFSVNTGLIHANPLSGIAKAFQAPKVVNRPTIKPEHLSQFMRDLDQHGLTVMSRCLIHWLLHTMVRPGEAAGARWDEIDFANKTWTIPAERMKMRKSHVVPLSNQAMEIIEIMRPISGRRAFIFPSRNRPLEHCNSETPNVALKRMGYGGKLVAHGLRSLASTTLNEQEFDPDVIEAALAHVDKNSIRATYNRAVYLEQRRVMMQWWSDHIEDAANGRDRKSGKKHLRVIGHK